MEGLVYLHNLAGEALLRANARITALESELLEAQQKIAELSAPKPDAG